VNIIKSDLSGWFDNSEKGDMSWNIELIWGYPTVALHLRNNAD
jgi:hypothetical protein